MRPAVGTHIVSVSPQAADIRLPFVFEGFIEELLRRGIPCANAMKDSDR
jgi:hypothetical protein